MAEGWRFLRQDTEPLAKTDAWETVSVPHTWNAVDGANGKAADPAYPEGYYRGPAWYWRPLNVPPEWKGRRVFIRFEGVSQVADVLVNAVPVGQHRGAFAAFCFEITPFLRFDGKDIVRVRADNARAFDVAPLSGDFTVFGGIYRPVKLISTDPVCVAPLEHASPGLFLTTLNASADGALIEARALVSNGSSKAREAAIEMELKDAEGRSLLNPVTQVSIAAGETKPVVSMLKVEKPRLWQGRRDPYLYSVTVRVRLEGEIVDEVTQPLGIRTVELHPDRGFLLNGSPYPLHGVNRHQDRAGKGWAISDADQEEDHAMIVELGATTIRLAHYQQAEKFHELSDRSGIVTWQEIPLVDSLGGSAPFLENARRQLTEMILQDYNHPSIAMWGLYNELDSTPPWNRTRTAPAVPILESVQALAKQLDPHRPTIAASVPEDVGAKHRLPDAMAWNIYPGWYVGQPDDAAAMIEKYSAQLGGKRLGISEYGAGANPTQFQEGMPAPISPGGPFHPQEWQNHFHERLWARCQDNPRLFGTWIWVMFDFAADLRDEGGIAGLNDKGLVTRDRKLRKDTFYFYKANWNPAPMVYLASRRATPRTQAACEVKAYSNCEEVELSVNGRRIGVARPDAIKVVRWPGVTLAPGINRIEIIGRNGSDTVSDACEWELKPAP